MRMRASKNRSGLILLVVLGMLTLFSMLTITYIVFSGQSRAASLAMARREYRGTPAPRLTDEALRQLIRGTIDSKSAVFGHSLLEDIYGANYVLNAQNQMTNTPTVLAARNYSLLINAVAPMVQTDAQAPAVLGGRFLRIPLDLGPARAFVADFNGATTSHWTSNVLPAAHDVLVGRIVTFRAGPLANESFRIVRYVGAISIPGQNATALQLSEFAQQYSIVIDLNEANVNKMVDYGGGLMTIAQWINRTPAGSYLCHTLSGASFIAGHPILLNGAPLSGHGLGMALTGLPQQHSLAAGYVSSFAAPSYSFNTNPPVELTSMPVSLQPRFGDLRQMTGVPQTPLVPQVPVGLANESYDAADYNDFFMALRAPASAGVGLRPDQFSTLIVPSFHRAALVNYIVNWKDPATYASPEELLWTLERIQLAVGRPLSINVVAGNALYRVNPNFTGTNAGDYVSGAGMKTPQLNLTIGNWNNSWPGAAGGPKDQFLNWVRWLVAGPWDVDNDGDALADSVWVDLNLPLMTSPEGKLLKMLVAYYIEDFDSKLDLNATGNIAQILDSSYTNATTNQFADGVGLNLPQGIGTGPAEISLRHFFTNDAAGSLAYERFLKERYRLSSLPAFASGNSPGYEPGGNWDEAASQLLPRERYPNLAMGRLQRNQLPAFPSLPQGVMALGLDRLGNPLLMNNVSFVTHNSAPYGPLEQSFNDPYESRWRKQSYLDSPYTLDDWEKLMRTNDWDRSAYDNRLVGRFPGSFGQSVAPKSAHLRHPVVSSRSGGAQLSSMYELVNMILVRRNVLPQGISADGFREMFPFEFHRAERLNVNRPFGNGFDDNNDGQVDEPRELIGQLSPAGWISNQFTPISSQKDQLTNSGLREDYLFGQPNSTTYSNFEAVPMKAGPPPPSTPDENSYWGGVESRQLFARHLYCLAQLLIPLDYKFPNVRANHNTTPAERARILAQWAVNVVDFRDADSAMTRFPYDAEPFAVKRTNGNNPPQQQVFAWEPDDGVVWGMEQPELLLTESLATHDIRAKKSDPMAPDFYQYRIPQGSLFLELYCPRSPSNNNINANIHVPGVSRKLYNGNTGALKLGELSPADASGTQFPVWRVYIGETMPEVDTSATDPDRPNVAFNKSHKTGTTLNPLDYTFQFPTDPHDGPKTWNNNSPADSGFKFDHTGKLKDPDETKARIIVFTSGFSPTNANTPGIPTNATADDHVFVNQSQNNVELAGGEYLVIGPREVTYFGSRKQSSAVPMHRPNTHRIELTTNWTNIYKHGSSTVADPPVPQRNTMANSKFMIAAAPIPTTWTQPQQPLPQFRPIGINVSEPLPKDTGYYQEPDKQLNANDNGVDVATNADGFGKLPYDGYNNQGPLFDKKSPNTPLEHWGVPGELSGTVPVDQGTQEDWCTAYLQRLADPDKPYHKKFNPYITVDWIPIDLTVFNGEDERPAGENRKFRFASRQKTGVAVTASNLQIDLTAPSPNLKKTFYAYHTQEELPETAANASFTDVYFDRELLVDDLSHIRADKEFAIGEKSFCTLGFLNSGFELTEPLVSVAAGFLGAPRHVPQSPIWLNRPFTNSLELTWVPLSSPGQFMQEFTGDVSQNAYASPNNGFAHLLNFFSDPKVNNFVPDYPASMLLDLTETPSPWSDTDEFVPPDDVVSASVLAPLRAPNNRLSGFVEPGRVNLNTLTEENVFHGLMWNYVTPIGTKNQVTATQNAFQAFALSRQGYAAVTAGDNPFLNPNYPTQFAAVFKSPLEAGIVPNTRQANLLDWAARINPTHATLMRGSPAATIPTIPLPAAMNATLPLFSPISASTQAFENHAFKKYLPFTRLANLTTTRSNVFSVRITIGFFEFDTSTGLGSEYGAEQGRARRHRSFYVVDRSQLVGFQVGQDLNTDKCILLRRVIE